MTSRCTVCGIQGTAEDLVQHFVRQHPELCTSPALIAARKDALETDAALDELVASGYLEKRWVAELGQWEYRQVRDSA